MKTKNHTKEEKTDFDTPASLRRKRCPRCNQWSKREDVEELGSCLQCDHVQGDVDSQEE